MVSEEIIFKIFLISIVEFTFVNYQYEEKQIDGYIHFLYDNFLYNLQIYVNENQECHKIFVERIGEQAYLLEWYMKLSIVRTY